MKPIALLAAVALLSGANLTATARTITSSQGAANENSVAGVAGPATAANASGPPRNLAHPPQMPSARAPSDQAPSDQMSAQASNKVPKEADVTPPPPMHDPN
jgi:hypothetical protein